MIVLNIDEYNLHKSTILRELKNSVFVYPTDTIYGIGCNATDESLVRKIRFIKKTDKPFSVIVPNKEWIYNNCIITEGAEEWIRKLPGPYTLILRLKNKGAVAKNVYNMKDNPTIEIEIAGHTDNVGADEYNLNLSLERANSVVAFIVSKGISQNRIIAKGYGESKPIASNDSEEGKQLNRRVEFTILKK